MTTLLIIFALINYGHAAFLPNAGCVTYTDHHLFYGTMTLLGGVYFKWVAPHRKSRWCFRRHVKPAEATGDQVVTDGRVFRLPTQAGAYIGEFRARLRGGVQ